MEEPNGAKANVALGSNTPVSPGKPYLVQINPTAAEEIGPASYDITVVRKCTFFNSSGSNIICKIIRITELMSQIWLYMTIKPEAILQEYS